MPTGTPRSRIPAWQRLGLKLKSEEEVLAVESHTEVGSSTKKRKHEAGDTLRQEKAKKIKTPAAAEPATPALARKKSVTFTPETKVEDGDSIKQLFNSWVTEQKAHDPTFQLKTSNPAFATPTPAQVQEDFDTSLDEKERRMKRIAKAQPEAKTRSKDTPKKKQKAQKIVKSTNTPTRPFLEYLRQYHDDRANWKFNKNHQNHILKNAFNLHAIPSDYVPLLYEYIRGLQGGVRTRLRDIALSIKIKDQEAGVTGFAEDMASYKEEVRKRKQQEYETACEEFVATMTATDAPKEMGYEEGVLLGLSDAAMKTRVAKRTRAEAILAELGAGATLEEAEERSTPRDSGLTYSAEQIAEGSEHKRPRLDDGTPQKIARKRKQRTANVEDTESSGDSSDSDDTDTSSSGSSESDSGGGEEADTDSDSDSGSGSGSGSSSGSGSDDDTEDSEESDSD